MQNQNHLTPKQILGYANDSLNKEEKNNVGRHLLLCDECLKLLPPPTKEQLLKAIFGEEENL